MGLLSFLGTMSQVHIIWYGIWNKGKYIGKDCFGNRYFTAKARPNQDKERRWVRYKDTPDASKVPPEWHGWLHYQSDDVPKSDTNSARRKWQKPHKANYTGTDKAYFPDGHKLSGKNKRASATGDYEAWSPPQ